LGTICIPATYQYRAYFKYFSLEIPLEETLLSLYGNANCVTVYYFRMYNIRAKKNLSQNFIMDPRLLDRIARDQFASHL
jgi:hypothetical protein